MPVERYEIFGCKIARDGYRQREHEGIPVGGKRFTWITNVADAADVGGENAHAHHPARNGVARRCELISAAALLEEGTAEHHYAQCKDDKDDEIYQMHNSYWLLAIGCWLKANG